MVYSHVQYQIKGKCKINPRSYFHGGSTRAKRRREVYMIISAFENMTATTIEIRKVMKQYIKQYRTKKLSSRQKRLYTCYYNSIKGRKIHITLLKLISAGLIVQIN